MNTAKQKSDGLSSQAGWIILTGILLAVLVCASLALLALRLSLFNARRTAHVMNVSPLSYTSQSNAPSGSPSGTQGGGQPAQGSSRRGWNPSFVAFDDKQQWQLETEIDLFHPEYEDTVLSQNGEKVVAPGTAGQYDYTFLNDGDVSIDYEMKVEAFFGPEERILPVDAIIVREDSIVLGGGSSDLRPFLELDGLEDSGTLAAGYHMGYTVYWQWPFERLDENGELLDVEDTWLGDLAAAGEDSTLTLRITVVAMADVDPGAPGGFAPQTGDRAPIRLLVWVILISAAGVAVPGLLRRKNGVENED